MLRPEQMSKISVTGSKRVMSDVIETMHEMNLVHITDYDGSWEGFEPGNSLEGADEVSSSLVTVRALENILDLEDEEVGPTTTVDLTNADERLEEVREEVNELDERRDELRDRQRDIDEQLEQMELFADLGLDLDLLWGYDSIDVLVGEGDATAIRSALEETADVEAFDVFTGSETNSVAAFASMADDAALEDALVGVQVTTFEVPETTGDPESNVGELEQDRKRVEAELESVEADLEQIKLDVGNFLLALEEELTIEAQKTEAPLRFATTERSFIVEGWIPTEKYDELKQRFDSEIGENIEISELKRARYTDHGGHHEEEVHDDAEAATDGGKQAATDGGLQASDATDSEAVVPDGGHSDGDLVTVEDDPPVVQQNSWLVNPFEILVKAVNRPKYSEFDPTITIFLTFPLFFGFMIGDVGYGLIYMLIGAYVYKNFDDQSLSDLGAIIAWMGLWTMAFGILYGEVIGLHFFAWFGAHPLLEKGLTNTNWALTWLVIAVIVGWVHLTVGYVINYVEELQLYGFKEATLETGSWLLMLTGIWVFIFSKLGQGAKPTFLVGEESMLNQGPLVTDGPLSFISFSGFPETAGLIGVGLLAVGLLLLIIGPTYELPEFVVPLSHVLSYTRLTAVLLAKAGMALAANLLYWGAYRDEEGFHFIHASTPEHKAEAGKEIVFGGISNMGTEVPIGPLTVGAEGALLGIPVFIIAHTVVLAVGGTAAIQAVRLEYFEFFEKFYEGGGKNYEPFGHERTHTTDN